MIRLTRVQSVASLCQDSVLRLRSEDEASRGASRKFASACRWGAGAVCARCARCQDDPDADWLRFTIRGVRHHADGSSAHRRAVPIDGSGKFAVLVGCQRYRFTPLLIGCYPVEVVTK